MTLLRKAPRVYAILATAVFVSCSQTQDRETTWEGRTLEDWNCGVHSSDRACRAESIATLRKIAHENPNAVAALIQVMKTSGDDDDRAEAADILGAIGREDERVFKALLDGLKDESGYVRSCASDGLWDDAKEDESASPRFIADLASPDVNVRLFAAFALGRIWSGINYGGLARFGDEPEGLGKALSQALSDPDRHVRHYAAMALAKMWGAGPAAAEQLIVVAKGEYAPARVEAMKALGSARAKAPVTVPLLTATLQDPSSEVRQAATMALGDLGPMAADAVPELTTMLTDKDEWVRSGAARALQRIGPAARTAIPALLTATRDSESDVRESAIAALAGMAEQEPPLDPAIVHMIIPVLVAALQDEWLLNRSEAAMALGFIGPGAVTAVPALVKALTDTDKYICSSAAEALGKIGPGAVEAVPQLMAALNDEEIRVRLEAIAALDQIAGAREDVISALVRSLEDKDTVELAAERVAQRGKAAIGPLRKALQSPDPRIREIVARVLGKAAGGRGENSSGFADVQDEQPPDDLTPAEADAVVSSLMVAMADGDPKVRIAACEALAHLYTARSLRGLGPAAKAAGPLFVKAIQDKDTSLRPYAIEALGKIAQEDDRFVPPLVAALTDPEHGARAAEALSRKGPAAVPALIEALRSGDAAARKNAARALGEIRPPAKSAGKALLAALADKDWEVQAFAAEAVGKVRPDAAVTIPLLIKLFEEASFTADRVSAALALYGADARDAVPALVGAARQNNIYRPSTLKALAAIGVEDEENARVIANLDLSDNPSLRFCVFQAILGRPDAAMEYLKQNPGLLAEGDASATRLMELLKSADPAAAGLRRAVIEDDNLSPGLLACAGRADLLPRIEVLIRKADAYESIYLKACARALGAPPDRVVRLSKAKPGDFRPASAWPGVDKRRQSLVSDPFCSHGDGFANVLITGRILMPDGSPAVDPRFFDTNDRWLLGTSRKDPAPIVYDSKTGRFVHPTTVFAAYEMGEDQPEPGPYQTGSAQVLIEACGAEPLTVRFFDEMPEVEITLTRKE